MIVIKELQLFARKLIFKQSYSKNRAPDTHLKPQEMQAIDTLISLLEENDPSDLIDRIDLEQLLSWLDQTNDYKL